MPRAEFLTIALLAVHVVLGLLCLGAARTEGRSPGLTLWGWGLIVYSAGLASSVAGVPTKPVGLLAGNILIGASAILAVKGALHYTHRTLDLVSSLVGLGITAVVLAYGNFFASPPNQGINIVAPTIIATVLFVHAGLALLQAPREDAGTWWAT